LAVDRLRLEQALINLVENALRHGAGTVLLKALRTPGAVEVHVMDAGPGFPPDFLPRAFERFSRSDAPRSGGGAGLGLSIVDVIARAHGGSAHAANGALGGADVWLRLPNRERSAAGA
jgi:signal transduction histidine kinase